MAGEKDELIALVGNIEKRMINLSLGILRGTYRVFNDLLLLLHRRVAPSPLP